MDSDAYVQASMVGVFLVEFRDHFLISSPAAYVGTDRPVDSANASDAAQNVPR